MHRLFVLICVGGIWLGCIDNTTSSVEINFATVVGKYAGLEKSCSTNTGDTLCSGNYAAEYSVILRTASSIQINALSGNIMPGLFQYDSGGKPPSQKFVFKNDKATAIYDKGTSKLMFSSNNTGTEVFFVFNGMK